MKNVLETRARIERILYVLFYIFLCLNNIILGISGTVTQKIESDSVFEKFALAIESYTIGTDMIAFALFLVCGSVFVHQHTVPMYVVYGAFKVYITYT